MIQLRLDLAEDYNQMNVLNEINCIKKLFNELEVMCPFLPKAQLKRSLELKGKFVVLKLKDAIRSKRANLDHTDIIEVLVEHKKKSFSINMIGQSILRIFRSQEDSLICGKQLESLLPDCEEFKEFHVDLLNVLTELHLNLAIEAKKTAKFSEHVTDAINYNVRSLNLKSNVMGYFEFLKLTKLQEDPSRKGGGGDFEQAIETCLHSLKNRIGPNEDISGKLQIIRLIVNETRNLRIGIDFSIELFGNCDFIDSGPIILEEMICLIEEMEKRDLYNVLVDGFLSKFTDQFRRNQKSVIETLLRLSEKNWTVKKDFKRTEELLMVIKEVGTIDDDETLQLKTAKCYLRLDKLNEAKKILEGLPHLCAGREYLLVSLEAFLRSQDEFNASECIEELMRDPTVRHEHFLNLYNLSKVRLSIEMKMKLLKCSQLKMNGDDHDEGIKINIMRGIISILYDGVIESGFTSEYKEEMELNLKTLQSLKMEMDQIIWTCQVCWNLAVIHARAEDYQNAQFGFKWCQEFSQKSEETAREFGYKSGFYYLTARLCTEDTINLEFDYKILEDIENGSLEVKCLKIEMLLRSNKWADLRECLRTSDVTFGTLAEIVLRASEEVPLEIYRLILEKLSENEYNSDQFDINRFSGLFRGLTTCSLLQFPKDTTHFQTAIKMIKCSFGRYPADEIVWLCGTALEMGRSAADEGFDWNLAGEWTEIALNLVYLLPDHSKAIKLSLQESVIKKNC